MAEGEIHARVGAVKQVAHGLAGYQRATEAALSGARADLNKASAEMQALVADRERRLGAARRRVEAAAAELARCEEDCGGLQRALAEAQVELQLAERARDRARRGQERLERVTAELLGSMRTHEAAADQLVTKGRRFVTDYATDLEHYLAKGGV
jgi:chromosome segregation ATPase